MSENYLQSAIKQFQYYQSLGEKTMAQLNDEQLFWKPNSETNSIAIIIQHLSGNMLSRWTDFLNSDGEKNWRNRDEEFEEIMHSKNELLQRWAKCWDCLFRALNALKEEDLLKNIYIRNQGHTVTEAINRQLTHYAYHVGQMVFIGKMCCDSAWQSLSIPKGNSAAYNKDKFSQEKQRQHFTNEFLKKD